MKRVFIGGSRRISCLTDGVRSKIDQTIEQAPYVLIGDANGADRAVQDYLSKLQYRNVVVFCTSGECRNNVAGWPVSSVTPPHRRKDFGFFTAKDAAMADEADMGLMLWDGQSCGTIVNVARLLAVDKPVVVYISPTKSFLTAQSRSDVEELLSLCTSDVRKRIDKYISEFVGELAQPKLL